MCRRGGPLGSGGRTVCLSSSSVCSESSVGVAVVVVVQCRRQGSRNVIEVEKQNHPLLGETKLIRGPCLSMGCKPEMRGGPSDIDQLMGRYVGGGVNNQKTTVSSVSGSKIVAAWGPSGDGKGGVLASG